jgi:putative Ca2+/H+ antiporter (TMEM165/GDT1 family)
MPPEPNRRRIVNLLVPRNSVVESVMSVLDYRASTALEENKMDWRIMLTTFGVIFLAEMGDKTQLAAMTLAAQKKRPWEVFIAASLALTLVSAIGVIVGGFVSHYVPLEWVRRGAGALFILIGALMLIGKF